MIPFFGYALLYTIIDFFSEQLCLTCSALQKHRRWLLSFAAGFTMGYLFLELFPRIFIQAGHSITPYVLCMLSLTAFYGVHKYLHDKQADIYVYKEAHLIVRTIYHVILGGMFFYLAYLPIGEAVTIALPVFLNTAFSSLMHHKTDYAKKSVLKSHHISWFKNASLLSTLAGSLIAFLIQIPFKAFIILLSIVSGGMLYVVIKEYLRDEHVSLVAIALGQAAFLGLMLALRIQ